MGLLNYLKRKVNNYIKSQTPDYLYGKWYYDYEEVCNKKIKRDDLLKTMVKGCSVLDELGVKYWLSRGLLLGLHRNHDFLPNDMDIDIDIFDDKDAYQIIKKMPFEVLLATTNKGHYQQFSLYDTETNVIFDIYFFHEQDEKLIIRNYYGYFWLPKDKFLNLQKITFEGREYPIPDPEWFCEFWYGENWRTPKKYGKDWSIDYRRDCNGFIYLAGKDTIFETYY